MPILEPAILLLPGFDDVLSFLRLVDGGGGAVFAVTLVVEFPVFGETGGASELFCIAGELSTFLFFLSMAGIFTVI
jgi:hypothetical protein